MALTKISVVHSKQLNSIIRVIQSDSDDSHIDVHKRHLNLKDETWIDIPLIKWATFKSHADVEKHVKDHMEIPQ